MLILHFLIRTRLPSFFFPFPTSEFVSCTRVFHLTLVLFACRIRYFVMFLETSMQTINCFHLQVRVGDFKTFLRKFGVEHLE